MPNSLTDLLQTAVPKPAHISSKDGGAVVALALHCLMIREGFTVIDDNTRKKYSSYQPPVDWSSQLPDQWIFRYTKDGKANNFVLHCSLQARTRRLFIHASEESNLNNIQVLGLQLENYVPDPSKIKSNDWKGVISNEEKMEAMFKEYVSGPLSFNAEEVVLCSPKKQGARVRKCSLLRPGECQRLIRDSPSVYVVAGVTLSLLTLGAFLTYKATRRS